MQTPSQRFCERRERCLTWRISKTTPTSALGSAIILSLQDHIQMPRWKSSSPASTLQRSRGCPPSTTSTFGTVSCIYLRRNQGRDVGIRRARPKSSRGLFFDRSQGHRMRTWRDCMLSAAPAFSGESYHRVEQPEGSAGKFGTAVK